MGLYLEAATSSHRSEFQIADLKFANLKFTICNFVGDVPLSSGLTPRSQFVVVFPGPMNNEGYWKFITAFTTW